MDLGDASVWSIAKDAALHRDLLHVNNLGEKGKKWIDQLPDKIILKIFSYIHHRDYGTLALVCKKWRLLAYDPRLWTKVSLRPDFKGLQVNNVDALMALVAIRFGNSLRYIELPSDLITAPLLHELANNFHAIKCPNIKYMVLDFSKAMQLHDYTDLIAFPCNLYSLTICLSEVIFMEGFMRRIYQSISSIQVLHLIGTFELSDEVEEEVYEVINISKIKAHTPNLRVVNFYGINFVDDSHVELLTQNCIHLEALSLCYCLRVKGTSLKSLMEKCKKLRTLLLEHTSVTDEAMLAVEWENTSVHELDISCTDLSANCMREVLTKMPGIDGKGGFTYLSVSHCEFFDDSVLDALLDNDKLVNIEAIDFSYTDSLTEASLNRFIKAHGAQLKGLMICGKPALAEHFWMNMFPHLVNILTCVVGTPDGWFLKLNTKIHIDQIIDIISTSCSVLERIEFQWDPATLRYSEKGGKAIDKIRLRCSRLKSLTLADCEFYEVAKANFERAGRYNVVRTVTTYITSIVSHLSCYKDLLFN